jgi:hypothetical protein
MRVWGCLLIVVAVLLAFWPSLGGGFTSWDDQLIIVSNPQVIAWS